MYHESSESDSETYCQLDLSRLNEEYYSLQRTSCMCTLLPTHGKHGIRIYTIFGLVYFDSDISLKEM